MTDRALILVGLGSVVAIAGGFVAFFEIHDWLWRRRAGRRGGYLWR